MGETLRGSDRRATARLLDADEIEAMIAAAAAEHDEESEEDDEDVDDRSE